MKKIILISALLLVGCSQEQDTRLICECYDQREVTSQQMRAELTMGDALGPNSNRTACSNTNKQSLVFNQSEEKLIIDNQKFVENNMIDMFRDNYIIGKSAEQWFGIEERVELDRVLLILEAHSYIPELRRPTFGERSGSAYRIEYSQCRVVDGV